jgi:hypothetical protein
MTYLLRFVWLLAWTAFFEVLRRCLETSLEKVEFLLFEIRDLLNFFSAVLIEHDFGFLMTPILRFFCRIEKYKKKLGTV